MTARLTRLIVVGPLPPPHHGVTVSTSLVLANPALRERFDVEHLDTSDHRPGQENIGRWDTTNVRLGLRAAVRLVKLAARGPRGVVYVPLPQNAPAFLRESLLIHAAALLGWKVAGHLRGGEIDLVYRAQPAPMRWWMRATFRRLASVAVMGQTQRTLFAAFLPLERVAVVSNGTPEIPPDPSLRSDDLVLYLSNLRRRKGVLEALAAAEIVRARRPSARFLFVGAVEDDNVARALAEREAGNGGRIASRTPVTGREKDRLLLEAAVLLFPPTEPEGHPRVILEALAAGVPVVTTDRGTIAETVRDGVEGFVLPDADPRELAERILLLLEDEELRDRMGRAARARYLESYTLEASDRRLAEWLSGL